MSKETDFLEKAKNHEFPSAEVVFAPETFPTPHTLLRLYIHQRTGQLSKEFRLLTKIPSSRMSGIYEGPFLSIFPQQMVVDNPDAD